MKVVIECDADPVIIPRNSEDILVIGPLQTDLSYMDRIPPNRASNTAVRGAKP